MLLLSHCLCRSQILPAKRHHSMKLKDHLHLITAQQTIIIWLETQY